jgi:hypothetical protein
VIPLVFFAGWCDVISETDIWTAAKLLVDRYGDSAPLQAEGRATEALAKGDAEDHAIWKQIKHAAEELLRTTPTGTVH